MNAQAVRPAATKTATAPAVPRRTGPPVGHADRPSMPGSPFARIVAEAPRRGATAPPPIPAATVTVGPGRPHAPPRDGTAPKVERDAERPAIALDPLDPETRRSAQLAPPPAFASGPMPMNPPPSDEAVVPRARVSMEELLPQLVRRIAWAGDRRRGSVQMELGAGPHAGTVVTVHADEGRVRVELAGDDQGALRRRLEAKGFAVEG